MATDITMEVASGRVEIIRLNTKARKLRNQVDGKISLAFAILPEFSGKLFDVVYACLDSPQQKARVGSGGVLTPGEGARRGMSGHPPQGVR
jgi:hypothetical protein